MKNLPEKKYNKVAKKLIDKLESIDAVKDALIKNKNIVKLKGQQYKVYGARILAILHSKDKEDIGIDL